MSVGQKLVMLKIRSTPVKFLSLRNLEAAPEEAMQLRRLIKDSNESLGPYLFRKFEFWNCNIVICVAKTDRITEKTNKILI